MKLLRLIAIPLIAACLPVLATAQEIWRCGNSYSTTPCAQGRTIEPVPARPEADVQAALQRAAIERQLAERLRADRLREEAAAAAANATAVGPQSTLVPVVTVWQPARHRPAPRHHAPRLGRQTPTEDAGTWRAAGPSTRRAKG